MAINLGIIGTGAISHDFILSCKGYFTPIAVCGSSIDKARDFGANHDIHLYYDSVEELCKEPTITAVYIATPTHSHKDCAMIALKYGKHIIVEKTFGMNANEAKQVIQFAEEKGVFCMDANWMMYFPWIEYVKTCVFSGDLGDIVSINADMGFYTNSEFRHHFTRNYGSGSITAVGIYPISFVCAILPNYDVQDLLVSYRLSPNGVDLHNSVMCTFRKDYHIVPAMLSFSIIADTDCTARIVCTKGTITVVANPHFISSDKVIVRMYEDNAQAIYSFPLPETNEPFKLPNSVGLQYEVKEASKCILSHLRESSKMPHSETVRVQELMDKIIQQYKGREETQDQKH